MMTFQPQTLAHITSSFIASNINLIRDHVAPLASVNKILDTTIVTNIVSIGRNQISPDDILLLEKVSPCLSDDMYFDEFYWKVEVEKSFMTRELKYPFYAAEKLILDIISQIKSPSRSMAELKYLLLTLKEVSVSIRLMLATKVGVEVSTLRKTSQDDDIRSECNEILAKWKDIHKRWEIEPKDRDIEVGHLLDNILTWKQLYYHCKLQEENKLLQAGQRVKEKTEAIRSSRASIKQIKIKYVASSKTASSKKGPDNSIRARYSNFDKSPNKRFRR